MAWLPGYLHRKPIPITGGADGALTDYQLKLAVAFVTDHMQLDFDDLRFTKEDGETLIDAWLEEKTNGTSADVWVEFSSTPANGVEQTYYMYYGKSDAVSDWDGTATFIQYHGATSAEFFDTVVQPQPLIYEAKGRVTSSSHDIRWGIVDGDWEGPKNSVNMEFYSVNDRRYLIGYDEGDVIGGAGQYESPTLTVDQWYGLKIVLSSTHYDGYVDDDPISNGRDTTALLDNDMGCFMLLSSGTAEQEWSFVRKYAANPPTYEFGSEQPAPTSGNPFWYYQMLKRRNN